MRRVMLASWVAILVSLGIIWARSQGRAQPSDAHSVSGAEASAAAPR